MDHVGGGGGSGSLPMLDAKHLEQDGRANGIYIARFRNLTTRHGRFIAATVFREARDNRYWEHAKGIAGSAQNLRRQYEISPWASELAALASALRA